MKFGNPIYWILILPFLLGFFLYWCRQKKLRDLEILVNRNNWPQLTRDISLTRQSLKLSLLVLFFLFATLALLRPQWGFHWEEVQRRGVDIMVALDVSKSMLAEDISPNRLQRAKRKIEDLVRILQGDRVGLVAFAGVAFLQAPLTLDYGAVSIFLRDLDTDLIPIQGTGLGEAIRVSIKAFDQTDKKSRVLILITDGEDHLGQPIEEAKAAAKEGVIIYTVGIGALEGAPIPDIEQGGFKKNAKGEVVLSKLDETTLQKIALETGGSYVRSVSGDLDLEKIYQDINAKVQDKELKSGRRKRFEERFQWPLLLALLLLLWEMSLQESKSGQRSRRRWWKRKWSHSASIVLLIFFSMRTPFAHAFFGRNKEQRAHDLYLDGKYDQALKNYLEQKIEAPDDVKNNYNLANSYYKMKEFDKASELYQNVVERGDQKLQQRSLYNLGNVLFQQGKLKESIESYESALALNPQDEDVKHNLAYVRDELKRRLEEMKKQAEKQKQQPQQQKQGQQKQGQQKQGQQKEGQQGQQKQAQQKQDEQEKEQGEQKDTQQKMAQKEKQQKDQAGQGQQQKQAQKEEEKNQKEKAPSYAQAQNGGADQKEKKDGRDAEKQKQKEMQMQEANRWLSNLEEGRKDYLKKTLQAQGQRHSMGRDW